MSLAANKLLEIVGRRSEFVLGLFLGAIYLVYLLLIGDSAESEKVTKRATTEQASDDGREWIRGHQQRKPRGARKGSTTMY